jgi:3-oxoacyl-[acyl-carrier protein] reductase
MNEREEQRREQAPGVVQLRRPGSPSHWGGAGQRACRVVSVPADVTHARQVTEVVQHGLTTSGALAMLVHKAGGRGMLGGEAIEDISEALWDEIGEANLKSASMKARRQGSLGHFSSMSAKGAFGGLGTSAACLPRAGAKTGLLGFTSQRATALGPCGIRVNAVKPGCILTQPDARVAPRYRAQSAEAQQAVVASVSLGRPGRAEEGGGRCALPGFCCRTLCLRQHY